MCLMVGMEMTHLHTSRISGKLSRGCTSHLIVTNPLCPSHYLPLILPHLFFPSLFPFLRFLLFHLYFPSALPTFLNLRPPFSCLSSLPLPNALTVRKPLKISMVRSPSTSSGHYTVRLSRTTHSRRSSSFLFSALPLSPPPPSLAPSSSPNGAWSGENFKCIRMQMPF